MDINQSHGFSHSAFTHSNARNYVVIDQDKNAKAANEKQSNDAASNQNSLSTSQNPAAQNPRATNSTPKPQNSNFNVSEAYKTLAQEKAQASTNRVSHAYAQISHGNPGPNIIDTYA